MFASNILLKFFDIFYSFIEETKPNLINRIPNTNLLRILLFFENFTAKFEECLPRNAELLYNIIETNFCPSKFI